MSRRLKDGGQAVERDEIIFKLKNDQLQANLDEAMADVSLQKFNHDQSLKLLRTEAVAEQDLQYTCEQQQSNHKAQKSRVGVTH